MSKLVSVVIPSRREKFLQQTIDDLTKKAAGPLEIIVIHDGAWPETVLKDNPKLTQVHWSDNRGMRAGINAAVRIAKGDFILKLDGHCMVAEGFDEVLKADCPSDAIMIPRRLRLDADNWKILEDGRPPIDYHYLSFPYERPDDPTCSLHGTVWNERAKERKDIVIDEEMSTQGSCYFIHKKYWERQIGPLDDVSYGPFIQEAQEFGLRCWLGGGQMLVNKKTWYAHLHKGRKHGTGYGFSTARWEQWAADNKKGREFTVDFWMNDRWKDRKHDLRWLIEKFAPVPTWPADLDSVFRKVA